MRRSILVILAVGLVAAGCGEGFPKTAEETLKALAEAAKNKDRAAVIALYSSNAQANIRENTSTLENAQHNKKHIWTPTFLIQKLGSGNYTIVSQDAASPTIVSMKVKVGSGAVFTMEFIQEGSGYAYHIQAPMGGLGSEMEAFDEWMSQDE